jgi:hypothetical protein
MLIAISKYTKPLSEVDVHRPGGRQNPPVGGVIIAKTKSREEFQNILDNDPFTKAGVAEYKIIEFTPGFHDPLLSEWIAQ